jgi:hypothetical protein
MRGMNEMEKYDTNENLRSDIIRNFSQQITDYINNRKQPDKFIAAVLSNNISDAFRACPIVYSRVITLEDIGEMLLSIQSIIPPNRWGTIEKVDQYLGDKPCTDKETYRYECEYSRFGYDTRYRFGFDSIDQVKNGFWVNHDGDYTNRDDCYEWIPPSKIQIIRKLR